MKRYDTETCAFGVSTKVRRRIGIDVVLDREAADQQSLRFHVSCEGPKYVTLGSRGAEHHHIAGHHHDVESSSQIDRRSVCAMPFDVRRLGAGPIDHVGIEIDPDGCMTPSNRFYCETTRPTASIENAHLSTSNTALEEVHLSVNGFAAGLHRLPSSVVVVEIDASAPLRPAMGHMSTWFEIHINSHNDRTRWKSAPS